MQSWKKTSFGSQVVLKLWDNSLNLIGGGQRFLLSHKKYFQFRGGQYNNFHSDHGYNIYCSSSGSVDKRVINKCLSILPVCPPLCKSLIHVSELACQFDSIYSGMALCANQHEEISVRIYVSIGL